MALIHEMLYIAKDFSQINMSDYIVKLSQSVYQSFNTKDSSIVFEYDIDESLYLEIDRMIPIGLILNEIISNSLKYAFPKGKGAVKFCLKKKKGDICFTISDNGIGIPKDFDYAQTKSLGVQLIPMLCDQIDASLIVNSEKGTCYDLCFKAEILS